MPIINYPEVAILGIHRIRNGPVVYRRRPDRGPRDDERLAVVRPRVIDGLVAAEAVGALVQLLEHPESLLLEMA
jgi:pyruvate dehydrogenase E2 component (dihydrolipoamide acetyltransferase)